MSATLAFEHPFQSLKLRTDSAIERGIKIAARNRQVQAVVVWISYAHAIPNLLVMSKLLQHGITALNSPGADNATVEDLKRFSHELTQLVGRLRRMTRIYSKVRNFPPYRHILDQIDDRTEHLSSIAEGMQLSLSDSFGDAMVDAAEDLRSATGRPETERVLVGKM